jgi:hypothetical protein
MLVLTVKTLGCNMMLTEVKSMKFSDNRSLRGCLIWVPFACFFWFPMAAGAERQLRRSSPPRQSQPVKTGSASYEGIFEEDAFSLLSGSRPSTPPYKVPLPSPGGPRQFDREELMQRASIANATIDEFVPASRTSRRSPDRIARAIDELVAIGRQLAHDDADYSADVHYVRYADEMSKAAQLLRISLERADEPQADLALRSLRAACASCHSRFNP